MRDPDDKPSPVSLTIDEEDAGSRLDSLLTRMLQELCESDDGAAPRSLVEQTISRSKIAGWIDAGYVSLQGIPITKAGRRMQGGEQISVHVPDPPPREVLPDASVPFSIVYEDESIIVVDKPAGVVVHPGSGVERGTLLAGVLAHLGETIAPGSGPLRPGIVHRLDRGTTGLLVIAKTEHSYQGLIRGLHPPRTMSRTYLLIAQSLPMRGPGSEVDPSGRSGRITLPIGRDPKSRVRMAVVPNGKDAETFWTLRETFVHGVLLEAQLGTGRTHQIRVHFQSCRAAIVGDPTYIDPVRALPPPLRAAAKRLGRQALHASRLELDHPVTGERMRFEAPVPPDMAALRLAFLST